MTAGFRLGLAALSLAVLLPTSVRVQAPADAQPFMVAGSGWELAGDTHADRHLGREALVFGTGTAYLRTQRFRDGTIDFDLAASSRRTFVAVRFRAQSPDVWEEIYFRPHKSGLPDAVQYAPAFAGARSNWQLYHGPGETASATLPHGAWLHVKVVVREAQAAVFLGDDPKPALVVPRLAHAPREGFIGFWALDASAERGKGFPTAISGVIVRPGVTAFAFPGVTPEAAAPGVIEAWRVSAAFEPAAGPVVDLPQQVLGGAWQRAAADASGLVPLDRVVDLPRDARRMAALARLTIRADREETVPFSFGYSDDASVFLNRRLLFSGVNGYSYNFPRRDGLITIDQGTLHLPLRAGDNELVVVVSDSFGGWGLMGRLEAPAGVAIVSSP